MSNVFEEAAAWVKNSKLVMWVFIAAMAMVVSGAVAFAEDTYSSFAGIKMLETDMGMKPVSFDFTYWTMAIAPQVAQVVFTYLYMSNTKKNKWALWAAIMAGIADFLTDTWYRSNGLLLSKPDVAIISTVITLIYFTLGSEVFITVGGGITLELASPAIKQLKMVTVEIFRAITHPASQRRQDESYRQPPVGFQNQRVPPQEQRSSRTSSTLDPSFKPISTGQAGPETGGRMNYRGPEDKVRR